MDDHVHCQEWQAAVVCITTIMAVIQNIGPVALGEFQGLARVMMASLDVYQDFGKSRDLVVFGRALP